MSWGTLVSWGSFVEGGGTTLATGLGRGGRGVVSSMVISVKVISFWSKLVGLLALNSSLKVLSPSFTSLLGTFIGILILSWPAEKVSVNLSSLLGVVKSPPIKNGKQ